MVEVSVSQQKDNTMLEERSFKSWFVQNDLVSSIDTLKAEISLKLNENKDIKQNLHDMEEESEDKSEYDSALRML